MAGRRPAGWQGGLRAAGAPAPRPTGAEGTPPLPQKGPQRGGGDAAGPAHSAPQRPQPPAPAGVAADRQACTSAPERRADHARGWHAAAHRNSMGAAPPKTRASCNPQSCPLGEDRERVPVRRGPRESGPRAAPPPPPPTLTRQAAPGARGGPATPTERACPGGVRRREEEGQGREPPAAPQRGSRGAAARPPPPPACQPRERRPPPLRGRGDGPPSPQRDRGARERGRSTARPPAPAASSHGNRGDHTNPRQSPRTPHRPCPEKAGEQEPERYGGHALHDQNDASDTRFVACPGKAEGGNEAERPPAPLAPAAQTGGAAHGPPPPLPPPPPPPGAGTPRRRRPTPRGAHNPKPGRGEPGPGRPPPKHARRSKGPGQDTRRGTDRVERPYQRPAPGLREVRTPHHPGGGLGGKQTPRGREPTHTPRARGDYQKGNRTELAERTDRVEWRTSERG